MARYRFDLITCGDGWHWIDPELGIATAARLLRPGGMIARFWNYHEVDVPLLAAFEAVYREHAPQSHRVGGGFAGGLSADPFESGDTFRIVETRNLPVGTDAERRRLGGAGRDLR